METLRFWGLVVGSALIAFALWVAALGPERRAVQATIPLAAQSGAASPISFQVRFRGVGPIARAQAFAEEGKVAVAQRRIERELARQSAFDGLCFERFNAAGAAIVLQTCEPVASEARADAASYWLSRLRDMRAIAYAEVQAPEHAQ